MFISVFNKTARYNETFHGACGALMHANAKTGASGIGSYSNDEFQLNYVDGDVDYVDVAILAPGLNGLREVDFKSDAILNAIHRGAPTNAPQHVMCYDPLLAELYQEVYAVANVALSVLDHSVRRNLVPQEIALVSVDSYLKERPISVMALLLRYRAHNKPIESILRSTETPRLAIETIE